MGRSPGAQGSPTLLPLSVPLLMGACKAPEWLESAGRVWGMLRDPPGILGLGRTGGLSRDWTSTLHGNIPISTHPQEFLCPAHPCSLL